MDATIAKDDDLRDKIKMFMVKLDKIEARVKEVETVAASVPKLEAKLQKVEGRVESTEQIIKVKLPTAPIAGRKVGALSDSAPMKAFFSGASIGLLIIGLIAAAWFGLF